MYVSKINLIADRLNFLGQSIATEDEANDAKIYIKCNKADKRLEIPNKIRFYIDAGIYAEVTTVDKYNGYVLDKEICVNLYDLYNIVNNCDDVISFEIDEDTNTLVISSFYNETTEYDELEMKLPYEEREFPINRSNIFGQKLTEIILDAKSCYSILKELSIGNNEGFNIICRDKSFFMESYNPESPFLKTRMSLKDKQTIDSVDFKTYVPFSLFKLIAGSGELDGLNIEIFEEGISVNTDSYKFAHRTTRHLDTISETSNEYERALIVDIDAFYHNLRILNAVNLPNDNDTISIVKVDDTTADLTIKHTTRYEGSTRMKMAIFTDKPVSFSGNLFYQIFERLGIDAISLHTSTTEENKLHSSIENFMIKKEFFYDHEQYLNQETGK